MTKAVIVKIPKVLVAQAVPPLKYCVDKRCQTPNPQPIENFHRGKSKDGRQGRCKQCANRAGRERTQSFETLWRQLNESARLKRQKRDL
jgi:hypothetical protein